ncbi:MULTISPECIES: dihydromonapterin reductase [Motilimonas]|uniref:Dihydromonapterin reductase n=1 Tax=Motilimonas cestriensis TaxID=2742685 RepID=A0ABS8WHX9_9GAMM|nr:MULTISPECIES: dihydromonapterin reductase [Motilimonas]MCE0557742.1 dihydromonapterin reductase [Motilimonas sp. E26]MCE2596975.1 dihydromonapterin reductase [Motilimonas cestriensis]
MSSTIVITGAGQRIGLALANDLYQQGFQVIVSYRTEREGVRQLRSLGVTCIQADFSSQVGIETFIAQVKQKVTNLRAIIHNASDWAAEKNSHDFGALMQQMMQVHVQGPYQLNLALAPLLQANDGMADIIHFTDYVAEKGSQKHIAYAASKAALANLTLSFSAKLAPKVKVNSIAPALLMFNQGDDEAYKKKALAKSLMGLTPGEQEAVAAVTYLLQSQYITGRTIHLDGGRHLV